MKYISIGLLSLILGLLLLFSDDSYARTEPSELLGWLLIAGGGVLVPIGMVSHVIEVGRDEGASNAVEWRRQRLPRRVRQEHAGGDSLKYVCIGLFSLILGLLLLSGGDSPAHTQASELLGWLLLVAGVVVVPIGVVARVVEAGRRQ